MAKEIEYADGEWPEVVIVLLTWAGPPKLHIAEDRLAYTRRTLEGLKKHLLYPNYTFHIADDGSPPEYQERIKALFAGETFTFSDTHMGWDVNHNINVGMKAAFERADVIAIWPDDRFLDFGIDVRPYVRLLASYEDVCNIRINGREPGLNGTPVARVGKSWWVLDKHSPCTHVIHLGPKFIHKRYVERYGYLPEGNPYAGYAENDTNHQFVTQEGPEAVMPDELWNSAMMPWGDKSTWEKISGGIHPDAAPPPRGPDVTICGAGLAGATVARLCADAGYSVRVVEKRDHIAGQCYDVEMEGVLVHQYGPHYFRTNSTRVMSFLSRFTDWTYYPCVARAKVGEKLVPFPVNVTTLEMLYGRELSLSEAEELVVNNRVSTPDLRTAEQVLLYNMGPLVYESIYKGYTRKQWGRDASELDYTLATRYPIRMSRRESYYSDYRWHDLLPVEGYTEMVRRMLDHPKVDVQLGQGCDQEVTGLLVWTGPLDEYWGYRLGHLPYRSLSFEYEHRPEKQLPCTQVNYPDLAVPYTRVVEYTRRGVENTVLATEYPQEQGDPYYPVPCEESRTLAAQYAVLETDTIFCGRLAEYRYLYMDATVERAFSAFERVKERLCT
jgi:UDP-galactopyranose mutase